MNRMLEQLAILPSHELSPMIPKLGHTQSKPDEVMTKSMHVKADTVDERDPV